MELVYPFLDKSPELRLPQRPDFGRETLGLADHSRQSVWSHPIFPAPGRKCAKRPPRGPSEAPLTLDPDHRSALGVGSVGQPHDHDPQACSASCTRGTDRVTFRHMPTKQLK